MFDDLKVSLPRIFLNVSAHPHSMASVFSVGGGGVLLPDESDQMRIAQLEQKVVLRDARIAELQVGRTDRLDSR